MHYVQSFYYNCCVPPLSMIGVVDPAMTLDKVKAHLRQAGEAQKKPFPGPEEQFKQQHMGLPNPVLTSLLDCLQPRKAIDLGCGFSASTIELLEKGWTVIAVDSSREVLSQLETCIGRVNKQWITDKKIEFVCQKMEEYDFPKNIQLIHAHDSLPYCPPDQVIAVWDKMGESLAEEGYLVGTFFPRFSNPLPNMVMERIMKGWMGPRTLVECLLKEKNYTIVKCEYSKYWYESDPRKIEFIGKTSSSPPQQYKKYK